MKTTLTPEQWYLKRFEHYCQKLKLTKHKARKRLMICGDLRREFDRICDNKFWSNKEPGISWEERKKRTAVIFKKPQPKVIQLSLFNKIKL